MPWSALSLANIIPRLQVMVELISRSKHLADQLRKVASGGNVFRCEPAMLQGSAIALRRPGRLTAVHAAPSIRHRGRLALCSSAGAGKATRTEVHRQSALHGLFLIFCSYPPEFARPPSLLIVLHQRQSALKTRRRLCAGFELCDAIGICFDAFHQCPQV